jgi:hypothetical protein
MAIEILENTLLKLLVRRGTNLERQEITLDEGEIGYATDTQRLFIGDGTTAGGNIIGNKFLGTATTITDKTGVVNDLAFDSDNNTLQFISENDGSLLSDWSTVANLASAGNTTIVVDNAQRITVGTLSAGNFDLNALGSSLEIVSDKIALSGTINIDSITQRTLDATSYLNLPSKLKINSINYDWPATAPSNNSQLISNAENQLSWALPTVIQTLVPTSTASSVPVGSIVPYVSAATMVPYGWLKCDGSTVDGWNDYPDLSGVIGNRYGGGTDDGSGDMVLPNLGRGTVYGSNLNDPYDDTRYNVLTGLEPGDSSTGVTLSASPLSAFPTTFIIKAINDIQTPPTISFNTPLSASLNGAGIDNTATQFLSGTIEVGLSSNNDGWVANNNATVYKNVYIGTPVNILGTGTNLGPTAWTEVDVPASVPTSAKVVHLQYRIARRAAFFVTYDNSALPASTSNKYILGDAGGGSSKDTNGASGQTTTRFDRDNRNIYFALDNSRSLEGAPPSVTVDIIGWGE